MLTVRIPPSRPAERAYILKTILGDFLGLDWTSIVESRTDVAITCDGHAGELRLPDILLSIADNLWLTRESLPQRPLARWDAASAFPEATLCEAELPVIYGADTAGPPGDVTLPIDIFGSAFFMLTRYEEVASPAPDRHDRFPASASLAQAEGFLDRPIVNEYVEVLWSAMRRLWPQLQRRQRTASTFVTCDVDEPYLASSRSLGMLLRSAGGDLIKRRSLESAARRVAGFAGARLGHDRWDPANTFDWMMDLNEKAGNAMAFYFIADKTEPGLDGSAAIDDPFVLALMRRIHERGHEIGLHGSYNTYRNPAQLRREVELLRAAMDRAGASQPIRGARQHFLRWQTPTTARALAGLGLDYDTTLGFADAAGFRCGTCYDFSLFDLESGVELPLRERPLIVMEASVLTSQYMGLGYKDGVGVISELKQRSYRFAGEFVLLWHNSSLMTREDHETYGSVLAA